MKSWAVRIFLWAEGVLLGLLLASLGAAVLAMAPEPSAWEIEKPTPEGLWGLRKPPIPETRDYPSALGCSPVSIRGHRRTYEILELSLKIGAQLGASSEKLEAEQKELSKRYHENFRWENVCWAAAHEILGGGPMEVEQLEIPNAEVWDERQRQRFTRALWTWRAQWVGLPLAGIFAGMGIGIVSLRGLLTAFLEHRSAP